MILKEYRLRSLETSLLQGNNIPFDCYVKGLLETSLLQGNNIPFDCSVKGLLETSLLQGNYKALLIVEWRTAETSL